MIQKIEPVYREPGSALYRPYYPLYSDAAERMYIMEWFFFCYFRMPGGFLVYMYEILKWIY